MLDFYLCVGEVFTSLRQCKGSGNEKYLGGREVLGRGRGATLEVGGLKEKNFSGGSGAYSPETLTFFNC